jgi:glyceraldehyde 3-phosphate dehydrogenase
MIKIGINGFGRIGRAIFRNNLEKKYFDVVAINDINPDSENIAYTLNYDTLYDRLPELYSAEGDYIVSSSDKVRVFHEKSIDDIKWKELGIDFVIDASGVYKNVLAAQNLIAKGEVKKVFITHSPDKVDFTMVLGANHTELDLTKHHIISTSICDATAIAPVIKAIYHAFGIEYGYATTLHPWLSYQNLMDGPASSWSVPGEIYHHFALGRSSIGNMIPKPTTAITATCKVLQAEGITEQKIGSFSYRTPTAIVGSADLTLHLSQNATAKEVIAVFEQLEQTQNWRIIHNNWEPLVSLDFKKSDFSAVVDHRWTDVVGGKMLKLVLWYDNEWGYSARVLDQVKYVAHLLSL